MNTIQVEIGNAHYALPECAVRLYIDGKLTAYNEKPLTDLRKQGERQRQRILDLIDECGEVDLLILHGELEISKNGITRHLQKLENSGAIVRYPPEKRGTGNFITWARPA